MNYIAELNAFHAKMRRTPLSRDAQLLWFKLMDFSNSLFWKEEFKLDLTRMAKMIGVSKNTILSARK